MPDSIRIKFWHIPIFGIFVSISLGIIFTLNDPINPAWYIIAWTWLPIAKATFIQIGVWLAWEFRSKGNRKLHHVLLVFIILNITSQLGYYFDITPQIPILEIFKANSHSLQIESLYKLLAPNLVFAFYSIYQIAQEKYKD